MAKGRSFVNGQEVYETFDRIERTLKELRDAETYLEKTMLEGNLIE